VTYVHATFSRIAVLGVMAGCITLVSGCGDFVRQGSGPVSIVVDSLEAASGADPDTFGGTLNSDVITVVQRQVNGQQTGVPTIFNDVGRVTMRLLLKDQGAPGVTSVPSPINEVTITRYRVTYRRADGRNTPGVDVPFPFDGAVTFTIPAQGTVQTGFELVRHVAKQEAPLSALASSAVGITTITEVQFFGHDQAGHDVLATGNIGIIFGNFGDPN
jgi:hypothetical protein